MKQAGYLSLIAASMIVLFGLLAAAITHMYISNTTSSSHLIAANDAFYQAESGLEEGRYRLSIPNLASRSQCSTLSATMTLATGSYQIAPASDAEHSINPRFASTTLVAISATTLQVSDSSVLSPSGRILIDSEVIEYNVNDTNSNTLSGLSRGADGSPIQNHASGSLVSQFQCTLSSIGSFPATNPQGIIELQLDIQQSMAWAVGYSGTFLNWNIPLAGQWNSSSGSTNSHIRAISMLNYAEGWAVGDNQSTNLVIRRWQASSQSWASATPSLSLNRDLDGVSSVSSTDAYAVGQRNGSNYTIVRWQASSSSDWCLVPTNTATSSCRSTTISSSVANNRRNLFAVKVLDTDGDGLGDFGFAVGGRSGTGGLRGHILRLSGNAWNDDSISGSDTGQLSGVAIISRGYSTPIEAWAAGRSSNNNTEGKILRWNGSWSVNVTTNRRMRAISMIDTTGDGLADYGWAVGNNGRAYQYQAGSWQAFTISNRTLYGVVVTSSTDAWAVGNNGTRLHWDGSSWNSVTTGVSTNNRLTAVEAIGPLQSSASDWRMVVH